METTNSVYINREFDCSIDELFNWIVDPELICQWFGPKQFTAGEVKVDLKIGGKYSIELREPGNKHFFIEGEYLEIDKPHKVVFGFAYKGVSHSPPESIVSIILQEINAQRTSLSLVQKFEVMPGDMKDRTVTWNSILEKLARVLRSG